MRMKDIGYLSLRYTLRQRHRLLPVLLGVALGVALLVVVITGATTISDTSSHQILGQGGLRQITVTAATGAEQSSAAGGSLTASQLVAFQHLAHVTATYPIVQDQLAATSGDNEYFIALTNLPSAQDTPALMQGAWPSGNQIIVPDTGIQDKSRSAIPGAQLIGKTLQFDVRTLRGLGASSTIAVTVVGVYHASTNDAVGLTASYAPLPVLVHMLAVADGQSDTTYSASMMYTAAVVDTDAPQNTAAVAQRLDADGFITNYVEKQVRGLSAKLTAMTLVALVIVGMLVLFSALSIGNLLASSVRQRRTEIALMLALGFEERSMGLMIAGESLSIGVAGALAGSLLALLGIGVFHLTQPSISLVAPWWSVPAGLVLTALLCLAAGYVPARRAMHVDAVRALQEV